MSAPERAPERALEFGIARKVVALSLPLMGTMVGNLLMMVVDRICLARHSSDTLAASGPAVFTAMTIIAFFTATANLSRSCVAQAMGRDGEAQACHEAFLGVVLAAGLAAVLLALSPVMSLIPGLSSRPPRITALESQFLALAAVFGAVMTLNVSLGSYFNGIGRTKVSMRVGVLGQVVSATMIYGLVFGRLGLPELGMRGSALGTLCGTATMLVCYLLLPRHFFRRGWGYWRDVGGPGLRAQVLFRLRRGAAAGAAAGADELGNTAFVWLAALLGPVALAANNLDLTLDYLAIIPIMGLGIGCSVLCGNAIGRDDFQSIPRILRATRTYNPSGANRASGSMRMAVRAIVMLCLGVLVLAGAGEPARAEPAGHVTGVGGVFIKAKDPKALAAWYRDVLGLPLEAWGGAVMRYDAAKHPPAAAWNALPASSSYFAPSTSAFMIDYSVDDLDAVLARVRARGVEVLKRVDDDGSGRFAWIVDPEGNKIELWEPRRTSPP